MRNRAIFGGAFFDFFNDICALRSYTTSRSAAHPVVRLAAAREPKDHVVIGLTGPS